MSDEEETFNDDVEFQNTQKEIEELRRREEELMSKMNAIAIKRKSASYNSLEDNDIVEEGQKDEESENEEEEEEGEKIGQRRNPSLSRGSSKSSDTSKHRPGSLEIVNEPVPSKSRSNRSSTGSPTKEEPIPSTQNSRSSSRTSLTSPTKIYSTTVTIKQGRGSSATSPAKSDSGKRNSLSSSGEIASSQIKQIKVNSKGKMTRSYSTPEGKSGKSPRGSKTELRISPEKKKIAKNKSHRRSFPNDNIDSIEDQGKPLKKKGESSSTTNLASTEVPENALVDRGIRGSRSSSRDGRSRNSLHINDDSYEIIEIEDEEDESASNQSKSNLSAREKIEQELAEQKQREEELRLAHGKATNVESDGEDNEDVFREESDIDEGRGEEIEEISDEEKVEKTETLSTWEKIALEIEEEKMREEEVRGKSLKEEDDIDSGEGEEDNISEEEKNDISVKINLEIEDQKRREEELKGSTMVESNGINSTDDESSEDEKIKPVSVQDRIEIEIKEIEKREKELKKKYNIEESDDIVGEGMANDASPSSNSVARSKIQQEIDDFRKKESEFRKLHGVEESEGSDEEGDSYMPGGNSLSIVEREIAEQKKKEMEYRKTHKKASGDDADESNREEDAPENIDEIPEDESMLLGRNVKGRSKASGKSPKMIGNSEYNVAPGITKKFIHMFNKGADQPGVRKQETKVNTKKEDKLKMNGQNDTISDEEEEDEEEEVEEVCEEAGPYEETLDEEGSDLDNQNEEEDEFIDRKKATGVNAPSPGKKLVLKRKKSKGSAVEENEILKPKEHQNKPNVINKSVTEKSKVRFVDTLGLSK